MTVMQDEIFGPILPVVPVATLDEASAGSTPGRPLAMYHFDWDRKRAPSACWAHPVRRRDAQRHPAALRPVSSLPFGGVGPSGMGAYHGWYGFLTFSHERGVFQQARLNGGKLITAPYSPLTDRLVKVMVG
jgi:coniferyl-aldehyde dehydrogenase